MLSAAELNLASPEQHGNPFLQPGTCAGAGLAAARVVELVVQGDHPGSAAAAADAASNAQCALTLTVVMRHDPPQPILGVKWLCQRLMRQQDANSH